MRCTRVMDESSRYQPQGQPRPTPAGNYQHAFMNLLSLILLALQSSKYPCSHDQDRDPRIVFAQDRYPERSPNKRGTSSSARCGEAVTFSRRDELWIARCVGIVLGLKLVDDSPDKKRSGCCCSGESQEPGSNRQRQLLSHSWLENPKSNELGYG